MIAVACSGAGATEIPIDARVERRLEAAYGAALSAERCALSMPYLNPIYRMPGSVQLEVSVRQATAVGLGARLRRYRAKWDELQTRIEYVCPGDTAGKRHDRLVQAVRGFDEALDPAIDQLLARTPIAPRGTSPRLVRALVEARWAAEHSLATNCAKPGMAAMAEAEKRRWQALRSVAVRRGRSGDLAAGDRRWAAEKVKWDRDTARFGLIVTCKAEGLRRANDQIERLLTSRH